MRSMNRICYGCWYLWYIAVCTWKPEQIVDIPVPQIVEQIAELSKSLIVCNSILNHYFAEIEVFSGMSLRETGQLIQILCRLSDVLVRVQFDAQARLAFQLSLKFV